MNETRIAAVTLFLGLLGLVYGGFSYIEEADAMKIAPIQASVENTEAALGQPVLERAISALPHRHEQCA